MTPFRQLSAERFGRRSAESVGDRFATDHGIEGAGPGALAALRSLPAEALLEGLDVGKREAHSFGGPAADGVVLADHYEVLYRSGQEHPVPLLVGATDADGFQFWREEQFAQICARFGPFRDEAEALYQAAGAGDEFRAATYEWGDPACIEPARHIARLHAANGHPTWHFRFSYVPEHQRQERVGAIHSSEIEFVFGTIRSRFTPTPDDLRTSETMRAYWESFLRDGIPDPGGLPGWPPFAAGNDVMLDFRADGPTVGPDPARERLDFAQHVAERTTDRYFDSAGVRIRYIDVGPRDGEPVVLVHGGCADIVAQWGSPGGLLDVLDPAFRVIALDLRGHGRSDKPHDPEYYGAAFAEDVVRLLDHLRIERAHAVGYSLGGRIVFRLVADHPDRLLSAMPNGTDGEPTSPELKAVFERAARAFEGDGDLGAMMNDQFNRDGRLSGEEVAQMVKVVRAANDAAAMAAVFRSLDRLAPARARLAANPVPCQCVIAAEDPNLEALRVTARHMPKLEIVVLPDQNHVTAPRAPEFVAAVRTFLERQAR